MDVVYFVVSSWTMSVVRPTVLLDSVNYFLKYPLGQCPLSEDSDYIRTEGSLENVLFLYRNVHLYNIFIVQSTRDFRYPFTFPTLPDIS